MRQGKQGWGSKVIERLAADLRDAFPEMKGLSPSNLFLGRQVRLEVGGDEFFIDLLFYHTRLKCHVVVELKAHDFKPEHAGQLNFYLSAVDAQLKAEDDKPTIGLLLCRHQNRLVAEYPLSGIDEDQRESKKKLVVGDAGRGRHGGGRGAWPGGALAACRAGGRRGGRAWSGLDLSSPFPRPRPCCSTGCARPWTRRARWRSCASASTS